MFKSPVISGHKLLGADDTRIRKIAGAVSESIDPADLKLFFPLFCNNFFIDDLCLHLFRTIQRPGFIHIPTKYNLPVPNFLLRQKWTGMQQALTDFNIPAVVKYFTADRRDAYNEVFQVYAGQIKDKLPATQNMELLEVDGQKAKFIVDFTVDVNGQSTTYSTYVIFELDSDGLWKINFF